MTESLPLPFQELEPEEELFVTILEQHQGLAQAIRVADMAEQLGFGRDKNGQRRAQALKKHLVEEHLVCVGCSSGQPAGWYRPETVEEIRATVAQYKGRLISLARLIAKTTASTPDAVLGQIRLELEGAPQ